MTDVAPDPAERLELLERRVKRLAAERNRARADFARLVTAARPFANQTARSLRRWLETANPDEVFRHSKLLGSAITGNTPHALIAQVLLLAETLATELDARRMGEGGEIDVDLYADRVLSKLEALYREDSDGD